jgi:hypothetical protein
VVLIDSIPYYEPNNYRSIQPTDFVVVDTCEPSTNIIEVCADPYDGISEWDELNNCATKSVIFCEAPDLYVKEIFFDPGCAGLGHTIDIIAVIADTGNVSASAVVDFYYIDYSDTIPISSVVMVTVEAGTDTTEAIASWEVVSDSTDIYVDISYTYPADYNPVNNSSSALFYAPGAIVGVVTDTLGEPIESVLVDGMVYTDSSGYYGITMSSGSYDISFSHVDYRDTIVFDVVVASCDTIWLPVELVPAGCDYVVGDVNGSDSYNGLDITYGVNFFKGGSDPTCIFGSCPIPPCDAFFYCGDVNASCSYNGLDITYGVNFFKGGSDPIPCPDCPPVGGEIVTSLQDREEKPVFIDQSTTEKRKINK